MTLTYNQLLKPKIIINSFISGGLIFFGALSSGAITLETLGFAIAGFGIAFLTQLRDDIFPKDKKGNVEIFGFI